MKKMIYIALLLLAGVQLTHAASESDTILVGNHAKQDVTLQELGQIAPGDYSFKTGDTIVINKAQTKYLTGEHISTWAYYVRHTIQQVGGKRFPNGVLLAGINSWLDPSTDLLLMGAVVKNDTSRMKEMIDRPLILERLVELNEMDEQAKQQIQKMAQQYHMTAMVEAAREQAVRDSLDRVQRAREQALRDSLAAVEAAMQARLLAIEDSLRADAARKMREQALADSLAAAREQAHRDSLTALRPESFNRVGAGLRVGVASLMQKTDPVAKGAWKAGFDILAEAQYAHYWQPKDSKQAYGILTGLSIGYTRNGLTAQGNRTFDLTDEDGDQLRYTITGADANEKDGTLMLEIPAMFSMLFLDNFFVNFGPRFSIPVFSHYNQDLSQAHIDAWNMTKNVHVPDELITGKVTEDMLRKSSATNLSRLNIQLSAEIGYEYTLPNRHIIGAGVYANYSVFSLYPNDPTGKELITIGAPTSTAPAPVDITTITDAYVPRNGLGFFDCGVKLIYHFLTW
ncbi:MAG: hypothetical protein IJQ97_01975 [Paludibacteraceae bacterium]|nr:hypothetical protein [Paludibacteraceae bacterium]